MLFRSGAVRIGGGYQGSALSQGGSNAISTSVDAGTTLRADATGRGDGGQVVVWSEKATQVDGTITARGGSQGGNGGLVETSSKGQLVVTRSPDASAPQGKGGTWLLDPNNLTINASGPDSNVSVAPGSPLGVSTTGDNAVIAASTITTSLNAGTSVTLSTGGGGSPGAQAGNISVNAEIGRAHV